MTEAQTNQPVFSIEKVYIKDLSLEIPNAPQVYLEREAPTVDIQLHHNSSGVEDGVFETVLTVTVTATNRAPVLAQPANMTVAENATADQALSATDADGNKRRALF